MMVDQGLFEALHNYIAASTAIDCHEHTFLPDARPKPVDLWTVLRNSDVGDDLISAGMPASSRPTLDWDQAAPYLPFVYNTGFYRSLLLAFEKLFDFDESELTSSNWLPLSEHIQAANLRPDWYDEVLHRQADIRLILRVQGDEVDPYDVDREIFAPLIIFDEWIFTTSPMKQELLAQSVSGSASTLVDYLNALDAAFDQAKKRRAAGVKSMLAYRRPLAHVHPLKEEAGRLFKRKTLSKGETKIFQDFMAHAVAERAGVFGFPYQVHVGYGSWQGNITRQANPLLLNPLIEAHRQTQFVLLHGGYPFIGEMGTLAKNHPNVYIECGWLAYIAPVAYRWALREWLDSVPANKLLAFSADCLHIEQTYGTLLLTRRLLAQMLAEKIEKDDWNETMAKSVVERLLYRNAAELYQLDSVI
jgi:predicted TIM-barrel fold metal-dependent hydrolase